MTLTSKRQWMVAVAMMWTALAAQATTYKWITDIGSGEWSDTAKWSPSGEPGISDTADFTNPQANPFSVSFTNDASAKLSLGSSDIAKPVKVTFDLNGHTLTHTNADLNAQYKLDWTILDGTFLTHATAGALNVGTYVDTYISKITIGAGATFLHNGAGFITVGSATSGGELVIRDGGKLINDSSMRKDLRVQSALGIVDSNYPARLTVTGSGSVCSNLAGNISFAVTAKTAEVNVMDNGLLVHAGTNFFVGSTSGADAVLNILSGGVVDARQAKSYMSIGNNGTGTVTVAGDGSALLAVTNQPLYLGNTGTNSLGSLIIANNGLVEKMVGNHNLNLGYRDKATGRLIVRDGGLFRWAGGQGVVMVGGAGSAAGSIGELTVTGATSRAIIGEFVVAQNRGNALVTVAGGGTLEIFRTVYIGRIATNAVSSHNGLAKLVVTGTDSVLKRSALTITELPGASISPVMALGVGGGGFSGWNSSGMLYASAYGPGGKGVVVIENGGRVEINGTIAVYSNSTLRIDGGRTQSATIGLETNSVFQAVLRQGDANGTALMTATNATDSVRIWGATLVVERGADFTPVTGDVYTLITAGALNATINRFTYAGAVLQDKDLITVGGTTFKVGYTAKAVTLTVRQTGTVLRIL